MKTWRDQNEKLSPQLIGFRLTVSELRSVLLLELVQRHWTGFLAP